MTNFTGRADLHIHTRASDGIATAREMLDSAKAMGTLDVIAITDHDRVDAALWAYERNDEYPFDIIPGTEVTNRDGHILGLWVTEKIKNNMTYKDTVDAIHQQGGLAIFAHPLHIEINDVRRGLLHQRYIQHPEILIEAGFDAIEGFNAASVIPGINILATHLARRTGLAIVAGSDAHTVNSINRGVTLFPGKNADDLRRAIQTGNTGIDGRKWHLKDIFQFIRYKQWNTSDEFYPEPEASTRKSL